MSVAHKGKCKTINNINATRCVALIRKEEGAFLIGCDVRVFSEDGTLWLENEWI